MVALAERFRLELDSSDRKNLVGSQMIPDKARDRTTEIAKLMSHRHHAKPIAPQIVPQRAVSLSPIPYPPTR